MHELSRSVPAAASAAFLPVICASRGLGADNGEQWQGIRRPATAKLEGKRECIQQQLDVVKSVRQHNPGKLNIRLATTWNS